MCVIPDSHLETPFSEQGRILNGSSKLQRQRPSPKMLQFLAVEDSSQLAAGSLNKLLCHWFDMIFQ
jgi:hypothetical protein